MITSWLRMLHYCETTATVEPFAKAAEIMLRVDGIFVIEVAGNGADRIVDGGKQQWKVAMRSMIPEIRRECQFSL